MRRAGLAVCSFTASYMIICVEPKRKKKRKDKKITRSFIIFFFTSWLGDKVEEGGVEREAGETRR